eukprot:1147398-Pelagomonas_calceolata.AAC.2
MCCTAWGRRAKQMLEQSAQWLVPTFSQNSPVSGSSLHSQGNFQKVQMQVIRLQRDLTFSQLV